MWLRARTLFSIICLFITDNDCYICLISTVNITGCTVLTLCDGQLAVPASNCTLCGYVLEYYSALFVCLLQLIFVILLISTVNVTSCTVLYTVLYCTLYGSVLEYYLELFLFLSQIMIVLLPYIYS